jgi:hypothetical protein
MLSQDLVQQLVQPLPPIWILTRFLFSKLFSICLECLCYTDTGDTRMKKNILYCINKVKHLPFMMIGELHWVYRGWSAYHGGSCKKQLEISFS